MKITRPGNIMTGQRSKEREVSHRMKHNSSLNTSMNMFGYAVFYTNCYSPYETGHTQASCGELNFDESSKDRPWHLWLLWNRSICKTLTISISLRTICTVTCYLVSEMEMEVSCKACAVQWNEMSNNAVPCHMTRIVLDWFQRHNTEFQLTSSSPS